jgi:hypothetical protein
MLADDGRHRNQMIGIERMLNAQQQSQTKAAKSEASMVSSETG